MSAAPKVLDMVSVTTLKPSHDRKTKWRDGQKNTFGLVPGPDNGGTCPKATNGPGGCQDTQGKKNRTCYVFNVMRVYKAVEGVLSHNTFLLANADHDETVRLLSAEFERFRASELKRQDQSLVYRLHWSGDIFNERYAIALATAMRSFPDIRFWNYTRSFHLVQHVLGVQNLRQYLSVDPQNLREGMRTYYNAKAAFPKSDRLSIAYMSKTNDFDQHYSAALAAERADKQTGPDASGRLDTQIAARRWQEAFRPLGACPADNGKIPVELACMTCQKCIGLRQPIMPIHFAS